MKNIIERIQMIADKEKISIFRLEKIIGASSGVLRKAIQNKTDIQSKWISKILEKFPNYTADWLVMGRGEMSKLSSTTQSQESIDSKNIENILSLKEEISALQKELIKSKTEIIELERKVQFLDKKETQAANRLAATSKQSTELEKRK